jgi:acyl-CoA thioester hydrolase
MIDLTALISSAKRVHTSQIPIRWGDMDPMRHLNNAMYLRLMEENRIDWFRLIDTKLGGAKGSTPVMVNVFCEYLKPIVWPATVETAIYLGEHGRSSVQTFHTLAVAGEVYARGAVKLVWIDVLSGKSVPLPPDILALYG